MKSRLLKCVPGAMLLFILSATNAFAGVLSYTYDNAGRLTNAGYGGGKSIGYTYDNAGNLTQKTTSGACSYAISPASASVGSGSSTGSVNVTAATGCTWTAASNDSWISITSGTSGTGNGTVNYSVAANTTTGSRTGTLTIAGKTFTVTQAPPDATPPTAPTVTGTTPTTDTTPTWSWTAGGGGNGTFRYKLDNTDLTTGATTTTSTSYTPATALSEGTHTLYVQERNAAGTWSNSGSQAIVIDLTGPSAPTVAGATPTNNSTPTWLWNSGGGNGSYRYKLNDPDLTTGATTTTSTSYTPATTLADGTHTLYVQESDAAGNWSVSGSFTITIDTTLPPPPSGNGSNTPSGTSGNSYCHTWNWASAGGNGTFRYKLDDPDLTTGATETTETSYTACGLSAGNHTLYIQEQMSARGLDVAVWSSATAVTITVSGAAPVQIPTLSQWGSIFLTMLIMMSGVLLVRSRRSSNDER